MFTAQTSDIDRKGQDIAPHEERFAAFAARYLADHPEAMLRLKREHTYKVLEHARKLVAGEPFTPEEGRAVLLAALYHDVGRFPQYVRWRTFSDAQSENHATLSVRTVRKEHFLDEESRSVRRAALVAIALHNRYRLPPGLQDSYLKMAHAVRDADKLDIMRIMAFHLAQPVPTGEVVLQVQDEPALWTPDIARIVLAGKVPSYTDLKYVNDFRMLIGAWVHELHFATARRLCRASGHVEAILAGLPQGAELRCVQASILDALYSEGMENENGDG